MKSDISHFNQFSLLITQEVKNYPFTFTFIHTSDRVANKNVLAMGQHPALAKPNWGQSQIGP